ADEKHENRCESSGATLHHHVWPCQASSPRPAPRAKSMTTFRQPGAVTMFVTILVTCAVLFLFQKIIWLVVPGLLALMIYYCLRPLVDRLVLRGISHDMAVTGTVAVVLILTVGVVFLSTPPLLSKAAQLQDSIDRYLGGGQNLLRKTIQTLEEVAPVLKRASLS